MKKYFLLNIAAFCFANQMLAQDQLSIIINAMPPFPIEYDAYVDGLENATVIIRNKSMTADYEFEMFASIRGPYGIFGMSDNPYCTQALNPGGQRIIPVGHYSDLCLQFPLGNIDLRGLPDKAQADLVLRHILPEGQYQLCLQAKEPAGGQLLGEGCLDFTIIHPERPVIIQPIENAVVDGTTQQVMSIIWMHNVSDPRIKQGITYNVKMIDLGVLDGDSYNPNLTGPYAPYEAMDDPATTSVLYEEGLLSPHTINLQDLSLLDKHYYAIRVFAENMSHPLSTDASRSDIVTFQYFDQVDLDCGQQFFVNAAYPRLGDIIPFRRFPTLIRFEPYCDEYYRFGYTVVLKDGQTKSEIYKYTRPEPIKWDSGPRRYFQFKTGMQDTENFYSSHLALGDLNTLPLFERGKSYLYNASGAMQYRDRKEQIKIFNYNMLPSAFQVGMSAPKLTYPTGGIEVQPGEIRFNAVHSHIPESALPPFRILQITGGEFVQFSGLELHEYAVIQVSKSIRFDSVVYADGFGMLKSEKDYLSADGRTYRQADFTQDVYRDLTFSEVFSDSTMYYWRVGWLASPETAPDTAGLRTLDSSFFYVISPIDSFRIGGGNATAGNPVNSPDSSECGSPCEIDPIANRILVEDPLKAGDVVSIGKFNAIIRSVQKSGDTYTGEAVIEIPFLKNIMVKVDFANVKVNDDYDVFEGKMKGHSGGNELETISSYLLGQPMEFPIGWDTTISNQELTLAIAMMEFFPTKAEMDVTLDWSDLLPASWEGDQWPTLGNRICFHPKGLTSTMLLHLQEDLVFDGNQEGYGLTFKGGATEADTMKMCYVKWGCEGFRGFQIAGEVTFSEDLLKKDSGNSTDDKVTSGRVKAHFAYKQIADDPNRGFLIRAAMDPFQLERFPGWGFRCDTVFLDWSDLQNPPGFNFPSGYTYAGMNDPQLRNTWNGIYIAHLSCMTPKGWGYADRRTDFAGGKFIYGEGKHYISLSATNVVSQDGVIGRMGATVDTILGVISSDEDKIQMSGKLQLPFAAENSFLKYRGLFAGFDEWNMVVTTGSDSLLIPFAYGKVVLDDNSIFKMDRHPDSTDWKIKLALTGYMNLDDEYQPGSQHSSLSKLKFKNIRFENMGYETGKGFVNKPYFSQASPQKSLNGFPVQLDSIDFTIQNGNPGIYFKPKLTLVGDVNGFSVSAGLILSAEMNFASGKDFVSGTDVDLSDVELEIVTTGFELKGRLKFINTPTDHGLEGVLSAKLPSGIRTNLKGKFGTIKTSESAQFNTAEYFSYWYVDALVTFGSSGIPIFSGVSLYGLGGGLWYHMDQDTTTKLEYTNLINNSNNQESPNLNYSGIPYRPNFNSYFGMKLQGLFGSTNQGKTYNMMLAVIAQFNKTGGPVVTLTGDVCFMSDIKSRNADNQVDEKKKAFWGTVNFVYNGQQHFIDGQINLHARIAVNNKKVLYGLQANDRVANAHFHAKTTGDHYWFFKMGEPNDRAGLRLDLVAKAVDVRSYLQLGEGLSAIVPQPDPAFMALINNSSDQFIGASYQHVLNKSLPITASGFAFGLVLKDTFNFNKFQPFYFRVNTILGFDLNVTQSSERTCAENNQVPGINNWYATGQLYAGLQGDFGIHIDLWFVEGDYSILSGSVATLMTGGLPNPTWFHCKGTMKYEVLGLVRGAHSFQFTMGEKCTMGNGNPFSASPLIQDLMPAHQAQDVSVFATPVAAFALPMGRDMEFYDETLEKVRFFQPKLHAYSLVPDGNPASILTPSTSEDGYTISFWPLNAMRSRSWHTMRIEARGLERINGTYREVTENGQPWKEERVHRFVTGETPDSLGPDQIDFTYPVTGQNYFLKNETMASKGMIRLNQGIPELLYTKKYDTDAQKNRNYRYYLKFVPVLGGDIIEKPVEISGNQLLRFDVSALENSTTYLAQLVRRIYVSPLEAAGGIDITDIAVEADPNGKGKYATFSDLVVKAADQSFDYRIIPAKFIQLGSESALVREKKLYQFIFRTSAFNSLREKLADASWEVSGSNSSIDNLYLLARGLSEPFDKIDIQGWVRKVSGQVINERGLVLAGINLGINSDDVNVSPFNYLPADPVWTNLKHWYFKVPEDVVSLKYRKNLGYPIHGLRASIQADRVVGFANNHLTSTLNISQFISTGSSFSKGNVFAGLNNMVFSTTGTYVPTTLPVDQFGVYLDYGRESWSTQFINVIELARIIYAQTGNTTWGNIIGAHDPDLLQRINYTITAPVSGKITPCLQTFLGMKYQFPEENGGRFAGSQLKIDYATPGQCIVIYRKN